MLFSTLNRVRLVPPRARRKRRKYWATLTLALRRSIKKAQQRRNDREERGRRRKSRVVRDLGDGEGVERLKKELRHIFEQH